MAESRVSLPKQFLPLFNNKSLFKLTLERCMSLDLLEPIIVSSKDHGFLIDESVHELNSNCIKILEEEGKYNICYLFGCIFIKKIDADEHILIMPSDHLIPDIEILNDLIKSIKQINDMPNWITFLELFQTSPHQHMDISKNLMILILMTYMMSFLLLRNQA